MQTREALKLISKGEKIYQDHFTGDLQGRHAHFLNMFEEREREIIAKRDGEEVSLPFLETIKRKVAKMVSAPNENMPVVARFDLYSGIRKMANRAPADTGLNRLATQLEKVWHADPLGTLSYGEVRGLVNLYKDQHPRSKAADAIEAECARVGMHKLPVAKLARIAASINSQDDYDTAMSIHGYDGDRAEQVRARALVRELVAMRGQAVQTPEKRKKDNRDIGERLASRIAQTPGMRRTITLDSIVNEVRDLDGGDYIAQASTGEFYLVAFRPSETPRVRIDGGPFSSADEADQAYADLTGDGPWGDSDVLMLGGPADPQHIESIVYGANKNAQMQEFDEDHFNQFDQQPLVVNQNDVDMGAGQSHVTDMLDPSQLGGEEVPLDMNGIPSAGPISPYLKNGPGVYRQQRGAQMVPGIEPAKSEVEELDVGSPNEPAIDISPPINDGPSVDEMDVAQGVNIVEDIQDAAQEIVQEAPPEAMDYIDHEMAEGHTAPPGTAEWGAEEILNEGHEFPPPSDGWLDEELAELEGESEAIGPEMPQLKASKGKGIPLPEGKIKQQPNADSPENLDLSKDGGQVLKAEKIEQLVLDGNRVKVGNVSIYINDDLEIELMHRNAGRACDLADIDIAIADFINIVEHERRQAMQRVAAAQSTRKISVVHVPCEVCANITQFRMAASTTDQYQCDCGNLINAGAIATLAKMGLIKVSSTVEKVAQKWKFDPKSPGYKNRGTQTVHNSPPNVPTDAESDYRSKARDLVNKYEIKKDDVKSVDVPGGMKLSPGDKAIAVRPIKDATGKVVVPEGGKVWIKDITDAGVVVSDRPVPKADPAPEWGTEQNTLESLVMDSSPEVKQKKDEPAVDEAPKKETVKPSAELDMVERLMKQHDEEQAKRQPKEPSVSKAKPSERKVVKKDIKDVADPQPKTLDKKPEQSKPAGPRIVDIPKSELVNLRKSTEVDMSGLTASRVAQEMPAPGGPMPPASVAPLSAPAMAPMQDADAGESMADIIIHAFHNYKARGMGLPEATATFQKEHGEAVETKWDADATRAYISVLEQLWSGDKPAAMDAGPAMGPMPVAAQKVLEPSVKKRQKDNVSVGKQPLGKDSQGANLLPSPGKIKTQQGKPSGKLSPTDMGKDTSSTEWNEPGTAKSSPNRFKMPSTNMGKDTEGDDPFKVPGQGAKPSVSKK